MDVMANGAVRRQAGLEAASATAESRMISGAVQESWWCCGAVTGAREGAATRSACPAASAERVRGHDVRRHV